MNTPTSTTNALRPAGGYFAPPLWILDECENYLRAGHAHRELIPPPSRMQRIRRWRPRPRRTLAGLLYSTLIRLDNTYNLDHWRD